MSDKNKDLLVSFLCPISIVLSAPTADSETEVRAIIFGQESVALGLAKAMATGQVLSDALQSGAEAFIAKVKLGSPLTGPIAVVDDPTVLKVINDIPGQEAVAAKPKLVGGPNIPGQEAVAAKPKLVGGPNKNTN